MNTTMDAVEERASRAVEGILENESLTSNLDDASAKALLDWGIACAKTIAQSTAQLEKSEAEQVMSAKLRATHRLMRSINSWIGKQQEGIAEDPAGTLDRIIEQVPAIYGEGLPSPVGELRDALSELLVESAHNPSQMIAGLRRLVEGPVTAQRPAPPEAVKDRPEHTIPPASRRLVPKDKRQQRKRRVPFAARRRLQVFGERREEAEASCADWHRRPEDTEKRKEPDSLYSARRRTLEGEEKEEELEASRTIRRRTQKDREESGEPEH